MPRFLNYLDTATPLEERLCLVFEELQIAKEKRDIIGAFLGLLRIKDIETYNHSIRVALLCVGIAKLMHLDPKALLYAGLLHDIGKSLTDLKILQKTEGWTPHDAEEMKRHVADGCRILGGRFDFSREVIKLHHRFQREGYPKQLPKPLHEYSEGTKTMIALFGRLLALADCYDAMHRINDKLGQAPLTGQYIKEKMLEYNIDQRLLIEELYQAGIFTLHIETT